MKINIIRHERWEFKNTTNTIRYLVTYQQLEKKNVFYKKITVVLGIKIRPILLSYTVD